jgi:hypothetical protein
LRLTHGTFAVAECKSCPSVGDEQIGEIEESLRRCVRAAGIVGADTVFLGVVANSISPTLFERVRSLNVAYDIGDVGVHLIVNGKLHLHGNAEATEASGVVLTHRRAPIGVATTVGQLSNSFGGGSIVGPEVRERLLEWDRSMIA